MVAVSAVIFFVLSSVTVATQGENYLFDDGEFTYTEALDFCVNNNMVIAQPKTEELWLAQNEYLDIVGSSCIDTWIGLTYIDNNHYWRDGDLLGWSIWEGSEEPNNLGTENCARAEYSNLVWLTIDCADRYMCLCQDPPPAAPPPATYAGTTQVMKNNPQLT